MLDKKSKNNYIAWIISVILHLLLLLWVIIFPGFSHLDPPPQIQGILVNFGDPLIDSENQNITSSSSENNNRPDVKTIENQETLPKEKIVKSTIKTSRKVEKGISDKELDSNILVDQKAVEEKRKANIRIKEELEKQQKERAYVEAKSKFGSMFGNGEGKKTSKSKGVPEGKPNADALEGISKGTGKIGGGLKNRGLMYVPEFKDNSQKQGRVVIKICVNGSGKVISAGFTQRGSTTVDTELINIAIRNAKTYKFSSLEMEEQCGTVSIDFKLK